MDTGRRISAGVLHRFCSTLFQKVGIHAPEAQLAADVLVAADLRGVTSHGVAMIPTYIQRIRAGDIQRKAKVRIIKDQQGTALLDGGNGLGHVVAHKAMKLAIEKARRYGAAWVGVRGSNHFGMAAYYTLQAARRDMIGIALTVSNINTMAPWGGVETILGNNPLSVAIPTPGEQPIVYDAALSVAARRKIHLAKARGNLIPEGWALNCEGKPTTNPGEALAGLLVPIGSYKGTGLAFVISLLAGALVGAHYGRRVNNTNVGHLFGAIDVRHFTSVTTFKKSVDAAAKELRTSRRLTGIDRIYTPGERGSEEAETAAKDGVLLSTETIEALRKLALELGAEAPFS